MLTVGLAGLIMLKAGPSAETKRRREWERWQAWQHQQAQAQQWADSQQHREAWERENPTR